MNERDTNITELINLALTGAIRALRVSMPGEIVSFDPERNCARVKPLIQEALPDGGFDLIPIINEVPVAWQMTANASITFELPVGTTGTIEFFDRSMEEFLFDGGDSQPVDKRAHSLNDAKFIPDLAPFGSTRTIETGGLRAEHAGADLVLKSGRVAIGAKGGDELLDLVSQLADTIANGVVPSGGGPLSTAGTAATLKTKVEAIKGAL